MMFFALLLACSDPVKEYTIPPSQGKEWKQSKKGADIGQIEGRAPAEDKFVPGEQQNPVEGDPIANPSPPEDVADDRPEPLPEGWSTSEERPDDAAVGCSPIASSMAYAPKEDSIEIQARILNSVPGQVLVEVVKEVEGQWISFYGVECSEQKQLKLRIEPELGEAYIVVFVDKNGDGPSDSDPKGRSERIDIGTDNISRLEIALNSKIEPIQLPLGMRDFIQEEPNLADPLEDIAPEKEGDIPPER